MTVTEPASSRCPKCEYQRSAEAESCARCGLIYERWKPEQTAAQAPLDELAERLWAEALNAWEDPERHDAFVKHCSLEGLLPAAGRRYRERLDRLPSDATAAKLQARILAMAAAALAQHSTPPRPVTRSNWFWVVLAIFGVAGMLAGLVFGRVVR